MPITSSTLIQAPVEESAALQETIPGIFFDQARRHGDRVYVRFFRDGGWQTLSWAETAERAARVASALIEAGLRPGEHVALMSPNRPEWLYCDLGILAAGGVTVPIYPSVVSKVAGYIAEDSRARFALAAGDEIRAKLAGHLYPKRVFTIDEDVLAGQPSNHPKSCAQ